MIHAAWDIGVGDRTTIVFVRAGQIVGKYESVGQPLKHYIPVAKSAADGRHFMRQAEADMASMSTGKPLWVHLKELGISVDRVSGDPVEAAKAAA